jgi:hypothetical protein
MFSKPTTVDVFHYSCFDIGSNFCGAKPTAPAFHIYGLRAGRWFIGSMVSYQAPQVLFCLGICIDIELRGMVEVIKVMLVVKVTSNLLEHYINWYGSIDLPDCLYQVGMFCLGRDLLILNV